MKYTPQQIAEVCHEAFNGLKRATSEQRRYNNSWLGTTKESRALTVEGVVQVLNGATPEQCHWEWVVSMRAMGWSYAPQKSEHKKTSPNMVHYKDLPESQKMKNALFASIVKTMSEEK